MKEYNGENPQNARIKISYTGKKPKVKFSYPVSKKKSRTRGSMLFYILIIWTIINIPLIFYVGFLNTLWDYEPTKLERYTNCITEQPEIYSNNFTLAYEECSPEGFQTERLLRAFAYLFWLLGVPFFFYLLFRKRLNKYYPDFEAFISSKKYKTFKKENIIEKDGEIFIELPVFNNIICDFDATEEFSKYLDEFEIKEYDFKYKTKKGKNQNEFIWYARWYFKKKPTKGKIEVVFK